MANGYGPDADRELEEDILNLSDPKPITAYPLTTTGGVTTYKVPEVDLSGYIVDPKKIVVPNKAEDIPTNIFMATPEGLKQVTTQDELRDIANEKVKGYYSSLNIQALEDAMPADETLSAADEMLKQYKRFSTPGAPESIAQILGMLSTKAENEIAAGDLGPLGVLLSGIGEAGKGFAAGQKMQREQQLPSTLDIKALETGAKAKAEAAKAKADTMKIAQGWREDYLKSAPVKDLSAQLKSFDSLNSIKAPESGKLAGTVAEQAIKAFAKTLLPGEAVMEGDITAISSAILQLGGSGFKKLDDILAKLVTGVELDKDGLQVLKDSARLITFSPTNISNYNQVKDAYTGFATEIGVEPKRVVTDILTGYEKYFLTQEDMDRLQEDVRKASERGGTIPTGGGGGSKRNLTGAATFM